MKIAILHYSVPPIVGGVEGVIAHHARLLAADGHSVLLIAGRGEGLGNRIPLRSIPLADSQDARVLATKQELDAGIVSEGFTDLRDQLTGKLQEALAGMDILIAHNVCSLNKNLALTAALHRLHSEGRLPRLIAWHHDLAWTRPHYLPKLHAGYPWDLLRTDWGNIVHIVVSRMRQRELAGLMGIDPARVQVVPNGVDAATFYKLETQSLEFIKQTRLMDAGPILLLPVRITPRKNIELALRMLVELRHNLPQAALVITGPLGPHNPANRDYFEKLIELRNALGLKGSAHFLAELSNSFLPDEVIMDFFRIADALFVPSREEGFGIPLIEAAFSHIPVFCADIPALRELGIADAAFFSPDGDSAVIAERISAYFRSPGSGRFALRARSTYRWETIYNEQIAPLLLNGDSHV